ncbi:hypothetical protein D9M71_366820 [compost metagenome]
MLLRRVRFSRRDGHHFRAQKREHGDEHGADHRAEAIGHEAAVVPQARDATHAGVGQQAHDGANAQGDKTDNGQHLYQGQPELELTVVLHAEQVGGGQQQGDHQGQHPDFQLRHPGVDDGRRDVGFDRDDQHPEPPVHPADTETGPFTNGAVCISGKGAGVGRCHGHFGQHAHDQNHQDAGEDIRQYRSGARFGDGAARADEKACTNDPGNREHGDVTGFEPVTQVVIVLVIHGLTFLKQRPC